MKTLQNISTARNKSSRRVGVRSILTLVGIVTATICSLVLFEERHATERMEARAPRSIETSKLVIADLLVNAASKIGSLKHGSY